VLNFIWLLLKHVFGLDREAAAQASVISSERQAGAENADLAVQKKAASTEEAVAEAAVDAPQTVKKTEAVLNNGDF
jgi:hypothetical protein